MGKRMRDFMQLLGRYLPWVILLLLMVALAQGFSVRHAQTQETIRDNRTAIIAEQDRAIQLSKAARSACRSRNREARKFNELRDGYVTVARNQRQVLRTAAADDSIGTAQSRAEFTRAANSFDVKIKGYHHVACRQKFPIFHPEPLEME